MKTLLDEQQVRQGVERLASQIQDHYGQQPLTVIGVMTGSLLLLADLIRLVDLPLKVGVVQARSYRGAATAPGSLTLGMEFLPEVTGRHLLLVDDIFDTGHTLAEILSRFESLAPASLRSAVLLRKQGRREVSLHPDFVGFEIPDEFVVGYGLDYQDEYRHLNYIAALEAGDLAKESRS